jgi:phosphate:Na+ symporter
MHLDLISDLRRINSHICSIAYPILEEAGVLARTRLKTADETSALAAVADHEVQRDSWQKGKPTAA